MVMFSVKLAARVRPLLTTCTYLRSLRENLGPRPCRIDRAIARSIQQGRGLRFSRKDQTFKVNKLFIIWLFAWLLKARNQHVGITGE